MIDDDLRALERTWRTTRSFADWVAWARAFRRVDDRPFRLLRTAERVAAWDDRLERFWRESERLRGTGSADDRGRAADLLAKEHDLRSSQRARLARRGCRLLGACLDLGWLPPVEDAYSRSRRWTGPDPRPGLPHRVPPFPRDDDPRWEVIPAVGTPLEALLNQWRLSRLSVRAAVSKRSAARDRGVLAPLAGDPDLPEGTARGAVTDDPRPEMLLAGGFSPDEIRAAAEAVRDLRGLCRVCGGVPGSTDPETGSILRFELPQNSPPFRVAWKEEATPVGRPRKPEDEKAVRITCYVEPAAAEALARKAGSLPVPETLPRFSSAVLSRLAARLLAEERAAVSLREPGDRDRTLSGDD